MSLSFLSKKSFHVTNVNNVEKVWLAERQEAEEQRKLAEWKKQREEERQKMELVELQQETGHAKKGPDRVDFLYEQPMTAASEYLLGKPVEMKPEESEIKRVEHLPGSTFLSGQNNLSSATNEEFNKMTNDPLVLMRRKEQEALQRILQNPLKMKQIRASAAPASPPGKKKKKDKKKKLPKKHRKKRSHRRGSRNERERRAAEMAGAAQSHEAQRRVLLQEQPAQVAPEGGGAERPAFLDGVARDVYASTSVDSISDRINQSRHYMQRGSSAAAEGFMRPS